MMSDMWYMLSGLTLCLNSHEESKTFFLQVMNDYNCVRNDDIIDLIGCDL